jgi:hypothetical protein
MTHTIQLHNKGLFIRVRHIIKMKTLKRILQELNYGNTLFGDPYSDGFWKDTSEDAYEEFLQSIGVEEESNTMEEES